MSPKTDGRLSTMTTQDEAGNIRAFPSEPRPTEVWGERGNNPPSSSEEKHSLPRSRFLGCHATLGERRVTAQKTAARETKRSTVAIHANKSKMKARRGRKRLAIFFASPPTFSTRQTGYFLFDFLCYAKGRTIRKVMGGMGKKPKKNSCKGKCQEKKFVQRRRERKKISCRTKVQLCTQPLSQGLSYSRPTRLQH